MKKIFLFTLFFTINHAQFDWQSDGAPIRQGLHIEWQRTGDANSDGSMIYAWSDCRNGVRDVIAQKVDINGNNMWGDYGVVVVNTSGRQEDPQLVTDGNGGAFIIWMDYRDETDSEGDIYAQHVFNDGSIEWGDEGMALVNQPGQQSSPNICSDGQNGAYVIWKDNEQSSFGDIYATHVSSQGAIAEGEGVPIITFNSYRSSPSLNTGGSGDAVLVWSDDRNICNEFEDESSCNANDDCAWDSGNENCNTVYEHGEDLYAQRISVEDNTINTQWGYGGKLICNAESDQTSPRVAPFSGDKTIMTWEDQRDDDTDVYFQILDENGDGDLSINGVPACIGEGQIIKPRVKAEDSIAFIVWEDQRDGNSDIYAQKINSDGSTLWSDNGLAISTAMENQSEPRLTTDGNGGVYFVWEDQRNSDETGIDIYAQHVNSDGSVSYADDGVLICDKPNLQFNPLVRNDGSDGAFIVWGDQRSGGSFGMYIQQLTSSGVAFLEDGRESFFGIATDAANEPYFHGAVYLDNDASLLYWQDNRWGQPKIYGTSIASTFTGDASDYFNNNSLNGQLLTSFELAQREPKAILAGSQIALSFLVEESPNENYYLQLLNMDLSMNGSAISIADPSTSKQGFEMIYGNDNYIYYAFSENYDITVKKIDDNGVEQWDVSAITNSSDDIIRSIHSYPNDGCIIIYESQSFIQGSHVFALALDGSGSVISGWPVSLSDLSEDQYFESSVETGDGIFITFKDNTSGSYDVYGQYIDFQENLIFGSSGLSIGYGSDDQQESSVAYNQDQNEILVCYETRISSENDIHCNEINLTEQIVSDPLIVSEFDNNQSNPNVTWSGSSYLIAWEDSRNILTSEEDIYFQEYALGSFTHETDGIVLTDFEKKQERPTISKYSDSDNSFIIFWEDYRSTGKAFCANLYGQSYSPQASQNCVESGDVNGDGQWNVLDIVGLANCVLADSCNDLPYACAADVNDDGNYNVLDIVSLANCVLSDNCG